MKQLFNLRFATFATIAAMSFSLMACSSDEETKTEITVPAGNQDFFSKTITFDSSASEKSFTFTTNRKWTVSVADTRDGSTWCTVSPTNGESGTNTVSIRVEENSTYDERNAVVTLTANDSIRKIFVSQKQLDAILLSSDRAEVPVAGGNIDIEVKANVDYTISISDNAKSWIHQKNASTRGLTSSTLSFSIDKSEEYDKREGKIVFKSGSLEETVTVYQVGEGILSLTKKEFNVSSEAQELAVEINSNFDYDVELPQVDWISEIRSSTRGISTHTLRLAIAESDEYEARSAVLKIKDKNSSIEETVTINQAARGGILIVSQKEYQLSNKAQELTVEINSNFEYSVEMPEVEWIKEKAKTRGMSTHVLNLSISANDSYDERSAIVRVFDKNSDLSEDIKISQAPKPVLDIETKEFAFDEYGGDISVSVTSNVDYKVTVNADWISKSNTRSVNTNTHSFKVAAMTGNADRQGDITFEDAISGLSVKVVVKQQRSIYLMQTDLTMMDGGSQKLDITNNSGQDVTWSSSDNSVVQVNQAGQVTAVGKGTATITATTADGKHNSKCAITVNDITDFISARAGGGAISMINNLIQYGSSLGWFFSNNSTETVILKSLQLVDGATNKEGNIMDVNAEVAAGSSVSYSTTIGLLGIHTPVTCRFRYEYKGKEYMTTAVYENSWFSF
jgi:hypothetical protein